MRRLCVFCGSSVGSRPAYAAAARALAREVAGRSMALVYGGGHVGLMGEVADAAMAEGAEVIGVIPRALMDRELGHGGVTELRVVDSMHERKATMADLADAFVALPGGIGTLEELAEVLTWTQLGLHDKPVGLLDVEGYFDPLVAFLDRAEAEGFMRAEHRQILLSDDDPARLLSRLAAWEPAERRHWIDRESR